MAINMSVVPRPILHVPYAYIIFLTFAFPTFSLLTIATLGVYLHFQETTTTHCGVPNMIPSISAVVGGVTPERYIWRLGIALFSFPRLLDSFLYYNFLRQDMMQHLLKILNKLLFVLHWLQYLSLFGLTYVSSKENYVFHRNCFIGFIVGSISHMLLFLYLFKTVRRPPTYRDRISFRLRVAFTTSHIFLFVVSLYFFWRHNMYCEPYTSLRWTTLYPVISFLLLFVFSSMVLIFSPVLTVYSLYGLCEYLVVLTNIAFHTTEFIDFQNDFYISVAPPSRMKVN